MLTQSSDVRCADNRSGEGASAPEGVDRRTFLKWSGVVGGTTALVGTASYVGLSPDGSEAADTSDFFWSACTVNCGSRCPLRLEVKDGTIVRVLSDDTGTDELGSQQVRACVRGRAIRHRIYNPDRLKKPMKRKPGTKRGEEQWETISWDQALDEIAEKMIDIKSRFGNEALYINYGTGTLGATMAKSWPPDATPFARLLNTFGGYLDHYSDYSTTEITTAYQYFYGTWFGSNSFDDARNAELQVMFGNNPLETRMSGGGQLYATQKTKADFGVRTIVIDPRYSETAAVLGDDWVPLRPGTDAALIAGMIHVMLAEDLQDQEFLDEYTVGFDESTLPDGAPRQLVVPQLCRRQRPRRCGEDPRVGCRHHRHPGPTDPPARPPDRRRQAVRDHTGLGSSAPRQRRTDLPGDLPARLRDRQRRYRRWRQRCP